ncbi:AI-2E family transporter [Apibacter muscae]|uniref:AI-2E family transporter n=1 Tax=Apibacter muscae TaxID=2509004 RepID=UPI0011AD73DF|nr:AI-2E family transporter [Apibacter muscae]TWP30864.1 AI-2E family transporter [Apibacter muscae]
MVDKISKKTIHQVLFIVILLLLFTLIFSQLVIFLPSLLGAITLYTLSRDLFLKLTEEKKWNKWLTVFLIFILAFILISAPVYLIIELTYSKVSTAIAYSKNLNDSILKIMHDLQTKYNFDLLSKENLLKVSSWAGKFIPQILNSTINVGVVFVFSFLIFFFMIMNIRKLESTLTQWSPLKLENTLKLGNRLKRMILANSIGIPAVALIQGIIATIGYIIIGLDNLWFWFAVTIFAAMIPLVGATLAYLPIGIILFTSGQTWQPIFIVLYGFIIVGSSDNIARFTLLKKLDNVHPLITIFGVIFGMKIFGFLGLIFGPILLSTFFLLLNVYNDEFTNR